MKFIYRVSDNAEVLPGQKVQRLSEGEENVAYWSPAAGGEPYSWYLSGYLEALRHNHLLSREYDLEVTE